MLIIIGIADVGRVFYYSNAIAYAAREGARHAAYYNPAGSPPGNSFDNDTSIYNTVTAADPFVTSSTLTEPYHPNDGSGKNCPNYPYAPSLFPTTANAGYVFICFNNSTTTTTAAAGQPVRVTILYNFQPVTSMLVASFHTVASAEFYVQGLQ